LIDGFIYGLPEWNKDAICGASRIANPGCFATALQLALLPAAKAGALGRVHTTGITGSTGAGQGLSATSHFSWRANNIQPYKSLEHQHLAEVGKTLKEASPEKRKAEIDFVPWRGDFARGIFTTSVFDAKEGIDYENLYQTYYQAHPFTHFSTEMIDLKQVLGTNKCLLHIEQKQGRVVVHSAIDNLLKGASGQALQNMNLMFGLAETEGLMLKATAF
jgi:N-acetyl-gamma-glutamyl-phosphate reductase